LQIAVALVAATVAVGLWAYFALPKDAFLPIHRGFGGAIVHLAKAPSVAIIPAIAVLVIGLMTIVPALAPTGKGIERSALPYGALLIGLAGVFLVSEVALAERLREANFDVLRPVFLSVTVLLLILGNYLGKIRHNHIFGIRTPWTLSDARVWDKTHRAAGRLMVLAGLLLIPVSLWVRDSAVLVGLMVALTAGPPIWAMFYSRRLWRREHPV
jgi:uncharacterized membrane protein